MFEKFREWQKENPEWELCCDIPDTDILYIQWNELPKNERMSWIGTYGRDAKNAFEEFGTKRCKVLAKVLSDKFELHEETDWPYGEAMLVFKTGKELCTSSGIRDIPCDAENCNGGCIS